MQTHAFVQVVVLCFPTQLVMTRPMIVFIGSPTAIDQIILSQQ